jgi:hypothetical protein
MNLFTGEASDEFFGSDVPANVRALFHQAASAPPAQTEALLWTAQACAPECLATYYLLYKFHARHRDFRLAQMAAERGLLEAARQAQLPGDWRDAVAASADFAQPGPARFWLFTLKALAFIALRSGRRDDADRLLAKVAALDPQGSVGADVIAALSSSATSFKR